MKCLIKKYSYRLVFKTVIEKFKDILQKYTTIYLINGFRYNSVRSFYKNGLSVISLDIRIKKLVLATTNATLWNKVYIIRLTEF